MHILTYSRMQFEYTLLHKYATNNMAYDYARIFANANIPNVLRNLLQEKQSI